MKRNEEEIKKLSDMIRECATEYYLGEPLISDEEFDELVDELSLIDPHHPTLTTGWGMDLDKIKSKKIDHVVPMTGIRKVKADKDQSLGDFLGNVHSELVESITYKLDGCALELIFSRHTGELTSAITRGDGSVGQDVFDKFSKSNLMIHYDGHLSEDISVHCELVLPYDKVPEGSTTHPRNIVAGMLSSTQDSAYEGIKSCVIFVHNMYYSDGTKVWESIWNSGDIKVYRSPELEPDVSRSDLKLSDCILASTELYGYTVPTDGLVVVTDTGRYAVKIETESVITTVRRVQWNMSRTGKFVPLVYVDPILVNGAVIRKCSGHNYSYIVSKGIGVGSVVEVVRSGEIIPYITNVIETSDTSDAPTECPYCSSTLVEGNSDITCADLTCPERKRMQYLHFMMTVTRHVDGAGPSLYNQYLLGVNPSSFESFSVETGFTKGVVDNQGRSATDMLMYQIYEEFHTAKDVGYYLVGLGIDGLSWGSIEKYGRGLYDLLVSHSIDTMDRPARVRHESHQYLLDNTSELRVLLSQYPVLEPEVVIPPSENAIPICVTGSLVRYSSRNDLFKEHSDKVVSSDVKKCKYLVTNSDKMTSKRKYAEGNGIEILTEGELYSLLGIE